MHSLAEDGLDGGVETKRRSVIVMEPVAYEMHLSRAPYIPIGTNPRRIENEKEGSIVDVLCSIRSGDGGDDGGGGGGGDDDVDDVVNDGSGGFVLPYAYMFHCRSETSSRSTWRFSDADHSGSLRCDDRGTDHPPKRIGRTTTLEEEWGKDEMTWYLPQLARVSLRWVLLPGEDPEILDELLMIMMMIQFHDPR
ncbi:uncharacterized protein BO96DRAFT_348641 [Aspergillus niger CBS 101883]|uniref:uncharacterized protein n=1 Tax=Aspergillus lacticoffeatus (strain CBS 101883) TaxID=1450533 RepID=UPI000D7FF8E0|nr:uncharacterized protein BO96DRAFT_348641 [Aspergillus niger CBS 101883]PYH52092.1 hypothetical protein BO96DRAFT_348641 [Aspergillus niger CBS 101883]